MAPRSKRPDKKNDSRLWQRVTEDVKPLPRKSANRTRDQDLDTGLDTGSAIDVGMSSQTPKSSAKKKTAVQKKTLKKPAPSHKPVVASMSLVDQKKIAKGARSIDFRIDLHGMNRDEAYSALEYGLTQAGEKGRRRVLIITGKGEGVLNRGAHDWLTSGGLRHLVSEFSPAGRRHGGDGAFYATLRRKKTD